MRNGRGGDFKAPFGMNQNTGKCFDFLDFSCVFACPEGKIGKAKINTAGDLETVEKQLQKRLLFWVFFLLFCEKQGCSVVLWKEVGRCRELQKNRAPWISSQRLRVRWSSFCRMCQSGSARNAARQFRRTELAGGRNSALRNAGTSGGRSTRSRSTGHPPG